MWKTHFWDDFLNKIPAGNKRCNLRNVENSQVVYLTKMMTDSQFADLL